MQIQSVFSENTFCKDSTGRKTSEVKLKWRLDISQVAKVTGEQSEMMESIEDLEQKIMRELALMKESMH